MMSWSASALLLLLGIAAGPYGLNLLSASVLLLLAPWLLPLPLMALGLMVGVVQAFVFAFLTTAYIGLAVA